MMLCTLKGESSLLGDYLLACGHADSLYWSALLRIIPISLEAFGMASHLECLSSNTPCGCGSIYLIGPPKFRKKGFAFPTLSPCQLISVERYFQHKFSNVASLITLVVRLQALRALPTLLPISITCFLEP